MPLCCVTLLQTTPTLESNIVGSESKPYINGNRKEIRSVVTEINIVHLTGLTQYQEKKKIGIKGDFKSVSKKTRKLNVVVLVAVVARI